MVPSYLLTVMGHLMLGTRSEATFLTSHDEKRQAVEQPMVSWIGKRTLEAHGHGNVSYFFAVVY